MAALGQFPALNSIINALIFRLRIDGGYSSSRVGATSHYSRWGALSCSEYYATAHNSVALPHQQNTYMATVAENFHAYFLWIFFLFSIFSVAMAISLFF